MESDIPADLQARYEAYGLHDWPEGERVPWRVFGPSMIAVSVWHTMDADHRERHGPFERWHAVYLQHHDEQERTTNAN